MSACCQGHTEYVCPDAGLIIQCGLKSAEKGREKWPVCLKFNAQV